MDYKKDISIIVPLFNEKESLPELVDWIQRVMEQDGKSFELLMIDDGSTDGSWDTIKDLSGSRPWIHALSFRHNYGKSAALYEGLSAAQGIEDYGTYGRARKGGDLPRSVGG